MAMAAEKKNSHLEVRVLHEHASRSLLCFPKAGFGPPVMLLASSMELQLTIGLTALPSQSLRASNTNAVTSEGGNCSRQRLRLGQGNYSPAELLSFEITDAVATVERVSFAVRSMNHSEALDRTLAIVFPEHNGCMDRAINAGSCASTAEVDRCMSSIEDPFARDASAHEIRFLRGAVLTLTHNRVSKPGRSLGRWFVLLVCEPHLHNKECPNVEVDVHSFPERDVTAMILQGFCFMLLAPSLALLAVDAAYVFAYKALLWLTQHDTAEESLWPALGGLPTRRCARRLWRKLVLPVTNPGPQAGTIFIFTLLVFLSTAGQFVLMHFWLQETTSNHSICLYNEKCYYPGPWDIPLNHMLSHIGYFQAALHIISQASFAEQRCLDAVGLSGLPSVDVRPFHAIAAALVGEGVGSMFYHVCPSVETFQFDTCFMIPIVHMFSVTLLDWREGAHHFSMVLKYFLYILTPIWIFNAAGTWYDVGVWDDPVLYVLLQVLRFVWGVFAGRSLMRLFGRRYGAGSILLGYCVQAFVLVALVASSLPRVRNALGGTANSLLLVSVGVMVVAVGWQVYKLEICLQAGCCSSPSTCAGVIIKYFYWLIMLTVCTMALICFQKKVVVIAPNVSSEASYDANRPCAVGIFDFHDLWHLLSAVGLALFAMMLLDVKVHIWAREHGITIVREPACSDSDSTSASSTSHGHGEHSA